MFCRTQCKLLVSTVFFRPFKPNITEASPSDLYSRGAHRFFPVSQQEKRHIFLAPAVWIFLLHFPFNTKCCFPFNQVLIKRQERKGNAAIGVKFLTNSNTTIRCWCRSSVACQILTTDASNKCISPLCETRRRSSPQPMTPSQKQRALMEVRRLKVASVRPTRLRALTVTARPRCGNRPP